MEFRLEYKVINFDPTWWSWVVQDELNRLGDEGWQLIGIDRSLYIFGRDKDL